MSSSRVLVVNAGSSSLKFKLYDVLSQSLQPVVGGLLERIGDPKSSSITLNVCCAHHAPLYTEAPLFIFDTSEFDAGTYWQERAHASSH